MTQEIITHIGSDLERAVVVVGGGGHAKVAIEALRFSGWRVVGCTDFNTDADIVAGVKLLGGDELLPEIHAAGVRFAFPALGGNALRERKGDELLQIGFELPNAIGPFAAVSPSAKIGVGVAIFAGAAINADSVVEDFAIINTNASVDHDCRIGRAAHVAPGSALAGCVTVGRRSFLGAGTTVIPGLTIGGDTIIGAGSVVVRDIPSDAKALGVPARIMRRVQ